MDKVGEHGKGESVWLAFFLYEVLQRFAEVATVYGDHAFATTCQNEALTLARNVEAHAWDGEWYRRAYFDDGTPLGSHTNDECQIDSISQSWGVLSGAANKELSPAPCARRCSLVRRDSGVIQLLDPRSTRPTSIPLHPGYVPGVRENAASTRMRPSGRRWRLPHGDGKRRGIAAHDQSRAPWRRRAGVARYKVEPYVVTADVLRWRRRGAAAGAGTRDRRLAVPADRRIPAGIDARSERAAHGADHAAEWGSFNCLPLWRQQLCHHGGGRTGRRRDCPRWWSQAATASLLDEGRSTRCYCCSSLVRVLATYRVRDGPASSASSRRQQQQSSRAHFGRGLPGRLTVGRSRYRHGCRRLAGASGQAQHRPFLVNAYILKKARWPFGIGAPVFMLPAL